MYYATIIASRNKKFTARNLLGGPSNNAFSKPSFVMDKNAFAFGQKFHLLY
jgi:hypothetical protein